MLNYSIMPLNEKHIDEYCEDIKCKVENGICTMPLFSMTLTPEGDPAIDKAEIYCTIYEKYKAKLDAMGLPSGVLIQASIGHGGKLNESTPFQRFTKLSDGDSYETTCPLDEGFRAYIRRSAARIAATSPCHIMLDDDFRLLQRGGCGCPLLMAELNRRLGTDMTREELYGALCVSDEYRAEYYCNVSTFVTLSGLYFFFIKFALQCSHLQKIFIVLPDSFYKAILKNRKKE